MRQLRAALQHDALTERGLHAYRANGRALAQRALQAAFPVVAQLLGDENFDAVATRLWLAHPPDSGDAARWGGALPAWIDANADLSDAEPYLADVARVEWALHGASTSAEAVVDIASFALLQQHDPTALTLRLAPGVHCIASPWPVVSIIEAHTDGAVDLPTAAARLRARQAECALVWRDGLQPRLKQVDLGEASLLQVLLQGGSLDSALAASPGLAFDTWLTSAVTAGVLVGAALLPAISGVPR
jgi:hypothetical protein